MLPTTPFFALKTHFEPTLFAPSGASSSLQAPAAFKVASSSSMALSQYGQSGLRFAFARVRDSSASASTV